jgi:hypothetical protein
MDGPLIKKQRHSGEYETIDKVGPFLGGRVLFDAMGAKRVVADLEKTLESADPTPTVGDNRLSQNYQADAATAGESQ